VAYRVLICDDRSGIKPDRSRPHRVAAVTTERRGRYGRQVSVEQAPLLIQTTRVGDECGLVLAGEIDLSNVSRVNRAFESVLAARPHPRLLQVDLGAVTFMDTVGVGAIVRARLRAVERGCEFTLSSVSSEVAAVLRIMGLSGLRPDGLA
jgi:anti-sigma B factor antagonist